MLAIFDVTVLADARPEALDGYERYRAAVPALVARFGGRYLVRASGSEVLEGIRPDGDHRFHVIEFPDAEAARAFWDSDDYRAIQPLRHGAVEVSATLLTSLVLPAPDTTTAG